MLRFPTIKIGASWVACVAIALAASGAFAQEEQEQQNQSNQSQQSDQARSSDQDESQQSDSQRAQQSQESAQQSRQRSQQDQQSAEQTRQREEQARQRSQQQREESRIGERGQEEWSDVPQPRRGEFGRQQYSRESQQYRRGEQYGRDEQHRAGQRGGEDAGLGVSVSGDGREGIVVIHVHPGSPAEAMGLRQGDRITHVNGGDVRSSQQFISTIREMDPGDDIELDILRNREERTVRGELESREEALALYNQQRGGQSWQPGRETWQTGYEDTLGFSQGRPARGHVESQLSQIERQVNRLSREIEDLRFTIRDIRQQTGQPGQTEWGRETTAGYDEYQYSRPGQGRMTERWQEDRERQFDGSREIQRSREFDRDEDFERRRQSIREPDTRGSRQYDEAERSTGGQIGEERLRPGSQTDRE